MSRVDSVLSLTLPHPRLSLQDHVTCPHFVPGVGLLPDPEGIPMLCPFLALPAHVPED